MHVPGHVVPWIVEGDFSGRLRGAVNNGVEGPSDDRPQLLWLAYVTCDDRDAIGYGTRSTRGEVVDGEDLVASLDESGSKSVAYEPGGPRHQQSSGHDLRMTAVSVSALPVSTSR